MAKYKHIVVPSGGKPIEVKNKKLKIPANPIIPVIEGDGIGRDIMKATRRVVDAAVEKAYKGKKRIVWMDVYAGEKANELYGEWMPQETFDAIKKYIVALKGPLTTPVGGGFRSLNVTLRQVLNLYACVRPVKWFKGVGSPVVHPEKLNVVIFRENTEDVYSGIEWQKGSKEAKKVIAWMNKTMKTNIRADSGVGVKPISVTGTKRLVRKAIQHAIDKKRSSVTLVHKGNIMKYTEGAFRDWGYKLATSEFRNKVVTEDELWDKYKGKMPKGKILIKDRIADSIFQQVLTRPDEYEILATPNLNGDYLSDACAAQVGGLGMAPGANIGDYIGLFEATHGTAPKYADKDVINPGSVILSAVMMLDYMGWDKAAQMIEKSIQKTIDKKTVTYDLHRQMKGAKKVGTSEFATQMIKNM
ncbi:MAG: isocitrate dehydrogenase (NADP(+)) [candidate division Zixibacteria bacterium]|nr:isocitrate dehydrogenase (NADP(+)) [candidate division Zixibacteria bacterium]MDH3937938.1 isocitrate dehydrogenase (NADP(+)) [candidate division Zixibacteria bacterium]MDH4033447.1 isocitrate dehydrogenase (NADP(+)) [candidate division Zixibacteria bacterium]